MPEVLFTLAVLIVPVVLLAHFLARKWAGPRVLRLVVGGHRLLTRRQAVRLLNRLFPKGAGGQALHADARVNFCGLPLPFDCLYLGLQLTGVPGAGKTVALQLVLKSILPLVGRGLHVVLFDPKCEFGPYCHALLAPHVPMHVLNPFDLGSTRWALAKDVRTRADCQQLAAALIDPGPTDNPFWGLAACDLVEGILLVLLERCPGAWRLRDLVLLAQDLKILKFVLRKSRATRGLLRTHLAFRDMAVQLAATVWARLSKFATVAALAEWATREVSVREAIASDCLVLLPYDEKAAAALEPLTRLWVKKASELVLSRREASRAVVFLFDEMPLVKKCDLLPLILRGRSVAAGVCSAYQDFAHLTESLGGDRLAHSTAGSLQSFCGLRGASEIALKHMSERMGKQEVKEYTNKPLSNEPDRETNVTRPVVPPEAFKDLPLARDGRLHAYVHTPWTGPVHIDGLDFVQELHGLPRLAGRQVRERPDAQQHLAPLTRQDLERLNLL
jgi:hypothetical protein